MKQKILATKEGW